MKIKGLKKAVGEYQRVKSGYYTPERYGFLMYDSSTGELWVDEFYNFWGDTSWNSWNEYHSDTIHNIGGEVEEMCGAVTMRTVREYLENRKF